MLISRKRILRALGPDVVVCPFYSRRCKSHQKLKSHCKKCHCKSLALQCNSCTIVFGDSYALKIHMRGHSSTGRVHKCHVCNKAYLTKSKLNEHSKLHINGKPSVSTVIDCWLILNHWLITRRFVQNVQEQLISQKNRGSHTSVLIATRDTHALLMWSTIASPNILTYSCAQTDAFGDRMDTSCTQMDLFCAWIVHICFLSFILYCTS